MSSTWRTGTVSVTAGSTTVTGVDTAWQTAGIAAGDLFWPANWARPYEILSVASQTSLTLRDAFAGSTASGQAYAIQLAASGVIASQVGAKANAALTTAQEYLAAAAGGRFGDGTAATPGVAFAAQTNMGLFRSSASVLGLAVSGALAARVDPAGTSAPATQTVMTREKGDLRYLRASNPALIGTSATIEGAVATLRFRDTDETGRGASHLFACSGKEFLLQVLDEAYTFLGTIARFEDTGTALPNAASVVTREKGDARYAAIASSAALKDAIAPAPAVDVSALQRKAWVWGGDLPDDDPRRGRAGSGLVAEDVADVLPEAVVRDAAGAVLGLDPLALIGALVAEINALRARVEALEA